MLTLGTSAAEPVRDLLTLRSLSSFYREENGGSEQLHITQPCICSQIKVPGTVLGSGDTLLTVSFLSGKKETVNSYVKLKGNRIGHPQRGCFGVRIAFS